LFGLQPGAYVVSVQPPATLEKFLYPSLILTDRAIDELIASLRQSRGARTLATSRSDLTPGPQAFPAVTGTVPIFYPGYDNPALAEKLELIEAEERIGIDLQLQFRGTATIRGTVVGVPASQRGPIVVSATGRALGGPSSVTRTADGSFELTNMPPGPYTLKARAGSERDLVESQQSFAGSVDVEVQGNVDGVVISLSPAVDVRGKVNFDAAASEPVPSGVPVVLTRLDSPDRSWDVTLRSARDGSFVFRGIPTGTYLVVAKTVLTGDTSWRLISARLGSEDVLGRPFELRSDHSNLREIQLGLSRRRTELAGTVLSDSNRQTSGNVVLIFPKDARLRLAAPDLIQTAVVDQTGQFLFRELAAIEYFMVLLDSKPESSAFDSALLAEFEKSAVTIRIAPGVQTRQDLKTR
jgi:hypothetical protein